MFIPLPLLIVSLLFFVWDIKNGIEVTRSLLGLIALSFGWYIVAYLLR